MRISSPRLRRLDNALANFPDDSEAMLLSELDGYVAGLIVCPSPIAPSEWLPLVWSSDGQTSPFADEYDAKWYADTVIEHHDAVARALTRGEGRYAPFFEIDARHDEIMWELWIAGFEAAMILRPASWNRIAESGDERAAAAIAGMTTLVRIANDESDLDRAVIDQLTEEAPGLIPEWVATLNAWRSEHGTPAPATSETPAPAKLGRNDPCSCGSGRKYKKCCGAC